MQRRISACMLFYFSVTRENIFFYLAIDRLAKLEVRKSLAMRKHARDNVVSGVPTDVYKM